MQLKDSYILVENWKIKAIEKVLPLVITVIPLNSLLYLTNYITLEPLIESKLIFKLLIKRISKYIFQALI